MKNLKICCMHVRFCVILQIHELCYHKHTSLKTKVWHDLPDWMSHCIAPFQYIYFYLSAFECTRNICIWNIYHVISSNIKYLYLHMWPESWLCLLKCWTWGRENPVVVFNVIGRSLPDADLLHTECMRTSKTMPVLTQREMNEWC